MSAIDRSEPVEAVRWFNRFYTKRIGILKEKLLRSPFSLTEARVIYELAHHEKTTAKELCKELGVDAGYLSRILRGFKKRGLIDQQPSPTDGRGRVLQLTKKGQGLFAAINNASHREIEAMLNRLSGKDQARLIEAMQTIEGLLGAQPDRKAPYLLRPPEPGDLGWVVHRHGALYAEEYYWDGQFEGLVAGIVAKFIRRHDPKRERCWIAERDKEIVGSVFLVQESPTVAKLRLLLVEPKARGLGIGTRLADECIRFARQAGYRKIKLWTNDVLHAARHIYKKAGFRLVREEPHHSFGHDLIGETWELRL